ncbi:hypothetical protein CAOG_002774 [Capsaspora owczarzaki ATCC 30864]|uniref:TNFR-Cys domain-containing protein n=1 Tax=Capsaspora owczarzaki (strain ATCC 30864) TaxID=595528 RepID=A0A0D2WN11_CAPO3|nr:hypothetical protein CAOG_002774 [Capsaspora owczarzaki ATCC 30864]
MLLRAPLPVLLLLLLACLSPLSHTATAIENCQTPNTADTTLCDQCDPDYVQSNSHHQCCPKDSPYYSKTETKTKTETEPGFKCVAVKDCPDYGDPSTNTCVDDCPAQTFVDDERNECVPASECPPAQPFGSTAKKFCVAVNECPKRTQFGDSETHLCTAQCSSGSFGDPTNLCVKPDKCPEAAPFGDLSTQLCVTVVHCSSTTKFGDSETHLCAEKCSSGTFGDPTNVCVKPDKCPDDAPFGDPTTQLCVTVVHCSSTTKFGDSETHLCAEKCSSGTFGDPTNVCVKPDKCPDDAPFGDPTTQLCVAAVGCSTTTPFGDPTTHLCVAAKECSDANKYGDSETHLCAEKCSSGSFGDLTHLCVKPDKCPEAAPFGDLSTQLCVAAVNCSTATPFGDSLTHLCVAAVNCSSTTEFGDSETQLCVAAVDCSTTTPFGDSSTHLCVAAKECSDANKYGDSETRLCTAKCSSGSFGDTTNLCVQPDKCPKNAPFGDPLTHLCVAAKKCSDDNKFGDSKTHMCTAKCSGAFGDLTNLACVEPDKCPKDAPFGDPSTQLCVPECPSTSGDSSTHLCVACHESCTTCTGSSDNDCLTCDSAEEHPFASAANAKAGKCTKLDEMTCSDAQFSGKIGSTDVYSCFDCSMGCHTCTSAKTCTKCSTKSTLVDDRCIFEPTLKNITCSVGDTKDIIFAKGDIQDFFVTFDFETLKVADDYKIACGDHVKTHLGTAHIFEKSSSFLIDIQPLLVTVVAKPAVSTTPAARPSHAVVSTPASNPPDNSDPTSQDEGSISGSILIAVLVIGGISVYGVYWLRSKRRSGSHYNRLPTMEMSPLPHNSAVY